MTISTALKEASRRLRAAGTENPRLEAEILVGHVTQRSRVKVLVDSEMELPAEEVARLASLVQRRARREPLQYITGSQEFMGLSFYVAPGVLIPRGDTETLVEAVLERARQFESPLILDVGTGSGAIGVSLAYHLPKARVVATDVCSASLGIARKNARQHGVIDRMTFVCGDLLTPVRSVVPSESPPRHGFDFIVANLPYIRAGEIDSLQPEVSRFEPRIALDGGEDGLTCYRRLASQATEVISSDGYLVCEAGLGQANRLMTIFQGTNFHNVEIIRDLAKIERVVIGRRGA